VSTTPPRPSAPGDPPPEAPSAAVDAELRARLRELPAVDRLAAALANGGAPAHDDAPPAGDRSPTPAEAIAVARATIEQRRAQLLAGAQDEPDLVRRARERLRPTLRRVLNGTGVVIHTNLGRAPLAGAAVAAVEQAARGSANLELELECGRRGHRDEHVRELLRELTGAEDGLAVNNAAGAVLLAVAALAGGADASGGDARRDALAASAAAPRGPGTGDPARRPTAPLPVVVSRGQLVEIGGGFRIPDVVGQAGARLVEVGTTNRTRLADYERALHEAGGDAVLLRVHQSNFRTLGFVEEVQVEALCRLGAPVIDDVGSGALAGDLVPALADEPSVRDSVAAGAALTCFSGDKLLGGPQAGILVGRADAVEACRRHPLSRVLRIGRLPLAALAATLALYRDPERARREIPVLAMLDVPRETLEARAERLAAAAAPHAEIVESVARVGGGALPLLELTGPAVALNPPGTDPAPLAAALRAADPPRIPRIADGRVLVDPRTLAEDELDPGAAAIRSAATPIFDN
jgi:L-seryl-tRNA(Ser) seleniumtransferase